MSRSEAAECFQTLTNDTHEKVNVDPTDLGGMGPHNVAQQLVIILL